mgnify:CR=1 FL=1
MTLLWKKGSKMGEKFGKNSLLFNFGVSEFGISEPKKAKVSLEKLCEFVHEFCVKVLVMLYGC